MRHSKTITDLTSTAPNVAFPKPEPAGFTSFATKLVTVLEDNDLGGGWEWDPYEQRFGATWEHGASAADTFVHLHRAGGFTLPAFAMVFRRHVELDPTQPLDAEIKRLQAERAAFRRDSNRVIQAMVLACQTPTP